MAEPSELNSWISESVHTAYKKSICWDMESTHWQRAMWTESDAKVPSWKVNPQNPCVESHVTWRFKEMCLVVHAGIVFWSLHIHMKQAAHLLHNVMSSNCSHGSKVDFGSKPSYSVSLQDLKFAMYVFGTREWNGLTPHGLGSCVGATYSFSATACVRVFEF